MNGVKILSYISCIFVLALCTFIVLSVLSSLELFGSAKTLPLLIMFDVVFAAISIITLVVYCNYRNHITILLNDKEVEITEEGEVSLQVKNEIKKKQDKYEPQVRNDSSETNDNLEAKANDSPKVTININESKAVFFVFPNHLDSTDGKNKIPPEQVITPKTKSPFLEVPAVNARCQVWK